MIFDYVGLFENNTDIFINNLIEYYTDKYKKIILNNFSEIINIFLEKFKNNISDFIDEKYILEKEKNFSSCIGYSMDILNKTIEDDKINYQKYLNYTKILEYIKLNCKIDYDSIAIDSTDIDDTINIDDNINIINESDYNYINNNNESDLVEYCLYNISDILYKQYSTKSLSLSLLIKL